MSYWPHQFTKNGKATKVGEEQYLDKLTRPIMAQPMVCVHCHTEYIQGQASPPQGPCPARNDKREMKRIKG